MRNQSNKNIERYPPVDVGTQVLIIDAKIPMLNNSKAVIMAAPQRDRSPHKAIYKVNIQGPLADKNPWYVFRTEFRQM